jgi:hypothetical protein
MDRNWKAKFGSKEREFHGLSNKLTLTMLRQYNCERNQKQKYQDYLVWEDSFLLSSGPFPFSLHPRLLLDD